MGVKGVSAQRWEPVGFPCVLCGFYCQWALKSVGATVHTICSTLAYLGSPCYAMQFTLHSMVAQLCQLFDHSSVYCSGGWSSGQGNICPPFVSTAAPHSKVRLVVLLLPHHMKQTTPYASFVC